jgi:Spy/CpxP family protein refolding chaperone
VLSLAGAQAMKLPSFKTISWVMTAIALSAGSTLFSFSAIATAADSHASNQIAAANNQSSGSAALMEQLKLTDKQKNAIRVIRANRTKQINQVLNSDQKTKFEQARKTGKALGESLKELNLKPDQKSQILKIVKSSADNIKAKLTPAQLKTLNNYMKNHQTVGAGAME